MRNGEAHVRLAWRSRLGELLEAPVKGVKAAGLNSIRWDDLIHCAGFDFAVEYKRHGDLASVAAAIEQIRRRRAGLASKFTPLLVVDRMSKGGAEVAERSGVDWLDLTGNARLIRAPHLRIIVEGKAPVRKSPGRKSNVFATKSSRVAHWFLLNRDRAATHGEIAHETGVNKGQLSGLLRRLGELQLIEEVDSVFHLRKPDVLLAGWRDAYQPPSKVPVRGVIPSRSGMETVQSLVRLLERERARYVFGGLASAWLLDGYADFRIATCYIDGALALSTLSKLGFVETDRGANVWLWMDTDEVAFMGSREKGGISVASPYFTYIDLAVHPERAEDAASHLLSSVIGLEA